MGLLPLVLGILIYIHLFAIAFFNRGQEIKLSMFGGSSISMTSEIVFAILALYAGIATFSICYSHIMSLNTRLKKQMRNTEKASIQTESSVDKIKNLQAKIDTLEIALKESLKK